MISLRFLADFRERNIIFGSVGVPFNYSFSYNTSLVVTDLLSYTHSSFLTQLCSQNQEYLYQRLKKLSVRTGDIYGCHYIEFTEN